MTKQELQALPDELVSLEEQIAEVKRELALRENAYPRWVASGKMRSSDAERSYRALRAVLKTLQQALQEREAPDFLSEALNSGDGTYRP
jgi:hypothetical protein